MKTFSEFFAGVGLVREGLQSNAWECHWANDISSDKQQTYEANYGDRHFFLGDIWDVVEDSSQIPDSFLYTASFPCTDLSVAGNRAGLSGSESGTLNALFKILEARKSVNSLPPVVLLENVKGFLTSHKGDDVKHTVREFSKLGYYVDIIELDAIDFTAQSRPRVFCIAVIERLAANTMKIKSKNSSLLDPWWNDFDRIPHLRSKKIRNIILESEELNWGLFDIEAPVPSEQRLKDIVETSIPSDSHLWWNTERQAHLYSQMSDAHKAILNEMQQSDEFVFGTVYRRMRKGKSMAELRTDGFAGCLRTPRGGSSKQIIIQAGKGEWKVRLLTPREYARLQGVRDSFKLPENANKGYFAMGDAVCVPVIEFIAESILEPVYQQYVDDIDKNVSDAA